MPTVEELRNQCKEAELSTGGAKAQLTKRLQEEAQRLQEKEAQRLVEQEVQCPESPPPLKNVSEGENDWMCDAVLATEAKLACEEEEIRSNATTALQVALNAEIEVQEVWGTIYAGNRRGIELADLARRFTMLEQRDLQKDAKIASHEDRINRLEDRVSILTVALKEYKQVRERFIGTFKRDILGNATKSDYKNIAAGNVIAHGGDIAADALLFEGVGGRGDIRTFLELYGLGPSVALEIRHKETIALLNTHADVRAEKDKRLSKEYERKFHIFIEAFEESEYNTGYLAAEPPTALTRAYWDLWNCEKFAHSA